MKKQLHKITVRMGMLFFLVLSQSAFAQEIPEHSLKKEVTYLKSANEILQKISPISFKYNQQDYPYLENPKTVQFGFNAEQVQNVLPSLVHSKNGQYIGGKNLYKSYSRKMVDEAGMIPLLVASVKELQEQVNQLKDALELLKQTK